MNIVQTEHQINIGNDYGQFCDLEEYVTHVKQRLPSMETIPETIENSVSNQSIHDEKEHSDELSYNNPIINGTKNILNAKQYINDMLWATPEKKKTLLHYVVSSTIVCSVVIVTFIYNVK